MVGLKVAVMLLAAVGTSLGGVAEGGQTAAIKPQDLARVKEIAAMLRPEAGFAETRIENRAFWEGMTDAAARRNSIREGEALLDRPLPTMEGVSFFPRKGEPHGLDRKGISYRGVGHVLDLGSGMHSEQVAIVLDEPVGSAVVEVTWAMKGEQECK